MDAVHLIMEVYGVSDSTSSSVFTIQIHAVACYETVLYDPHHFQNELTR